MNQTNKILIILIVFLLVVIAAILIWRQWFNEPSFYAVYLRTGDIYFGRLTIFPYFGLKQVYLIQVNRDNPQSPLSVQKFSNVFWGPSDYLKINRNEVVWLTKLNSSGQLYQLIKNNPDLLPQPQVQQPQVQQPSITPSQQPPAVR
jgi:hypothetical protein